MKAGAVLIFVFVDCAKLERNEFANSHRVSILSEHWCHSDDPALKKL